MLAVKFPKTDVLDCKVNPWASFALVTESSINAVVPTELDVGALIVVCVKVRTSIEADVAGAVLKVNTWFATLYVDLFWYTPSMYTIVLFSFIGAIDNVNAVVLLSPVKASWFKLFPATVALTVWTTTFCPEGILSSNVIVVPLTV